jgi:NAD(P)-dependent dehydrogenase (short-subunit alcohol dehydrogenase family)
MHTAPVAIITGSSRGIGRAIAEDLSRHGYAVVINYLANREAAETVAAGIRSSGGTASLCRADIGSASDRELLVAQAYNDFGRLDLLVNNAGITSPGRADLLDLTEESWERVFATNLKGPFFLAQATARKMVSQIDRQQIERATIINISSISAYATSSNRADYCMAKSAMQMMTWLLADRLADEKIWVYEICPGIIESDMTAPVRDKYDTLIHEGLTPIRRWGKGADVAQAVRSLASGDFPFTTGERLNVDGGFHIRRL